MKTYEVKYKVIGQASSSYCQDTVLLYSASEPEAIDALKRRGTVGSDANIVILGISPR